MQSTKLHICTLILNENIVASRDVKIPVQCQLKLRRCFFGINLGTLIFECVFIDQSFKLGYWWNYLQKLGKIYHRQFQAYRSKADNDICKKEKYKKNSSSQNSTKKTLIWETWIPCKLGVIIGVSEEWVDPALHMAHIVLLVLEQTQW